MHNPSGTIQDVGAAGAGAEAEQVLRSCVSDGRRVLGEILLRTVSNGTSTIELYRIRKVYLTMLASGSSIRMQKGSNAKKLQGCEVGEMLCLWKSSPWAAVLPAAAKVEVSQVDPKWPQVLTMCSLSITESSQALGS